MNAPPELLRRAVVPRPGSQIVRQAKGLRIYATRPACIACGEFSRCDFGRRVRPEFLAIEEHAPRARVVGGHQEGADGAAEAEGGVCHGAPL